MRLKPIRGGELIKILCRNFGFKVVRRKGSHVTLERDGVFRHRSCKGDRCRAA
ncbi:MAG: type II toxin-antitoxin system HicA family toxin [Candidatus Hecatellaceae archaeon]